MPKVSVIVPSYNHADFISEAITSILNQTFQDFEVLILDDSSKDESLSIINKFTDERISIFVNEENIGSSATMNKLIELANGEYIALLNSDDVWEINKLEKQIDFMENNKQYGALFTNVKIIDEEGNEFTNKEHFYTSIFEQSNRSRYEWLNYFFNKGNCLCHPSILIRKSVYNDIGLYNPLMASLPDFEMWVRICLKYEIYIMPEKLVKFRILNNEKNASGSNPSNTIRCQFEYKQILNYFLSLSNEDYQFVFKEKVEKHLILSLSDKAINNSRKFMQNWGLDILYKFLKNNSEYMKANDFTRLTSSYDIFNLFKMNDYFIQLFIENENGFSEENSLILQVLENKEIQRFEFDLRDRDNIKSLRLDPLNDSCVIEIERLYLIQKDLQEVDLIPLISANDCSHKGSCYFFDFFDPNIYFTNLDLEILNFSEKLCIELKYNHVSKDAVHVCANQIASDKNERISVLEQETTYTCNSLSWKITRPLRIINKKIKNLRKRLIECL